MWLFLFLLLQNFHVFQLRLPPILEYFQNDDDDDVLTGTIIANVDTDIFIDVIGVSISVTRYYRIH